MRAVPLASISKFLYALALLANASQLLAICNNCEPNPASPTYASTAFSRPLSANARGRGDGPDDPVVKTPAAIVYLGSSSYSKAMPLLHLT